ncbi:MAG: F0F1 ATP synthase subunit B, partial [Cyclobacteriaceae bacterium]|nr:F0F1 ATP synthase subunit B [Cyclobacteriaceae bacterium]
AAKIADEMKDQAKDDAKVIGDKMIDEALASIENEKNEAIRQIKDQVAELSLQISEKLLKKNLSDDKSQQELIKNYMKDIKLN